jgi:hypothetical protein
MKTLLLLVFSLFCIGSEAQNHARLLPQPQQIKYGPNQIKLKGLTIYLPLMSAREDIFNANELTEFLRSRTGLNIPIVHEKNGRQIRI